MNIYWRIKEIWCPYPANDCIQERCIEYSTSKRKFDKQVFYKTSNQLTIQQRQLEIEKVIGQRINLIKQ
jgi:hypothetical protein